MTRDRRLGTGTGTTQWHKSSYSGPQGGNCVEVATAGGEVLVRDSKHPHRARLACTTGEWTAFLAGLRAGVFDLG